LKDAALNLVKVKSIPTLTRFDSPPVFPKLGVYPAPAGLGKVKGSASVDLLVIGGINEAELRGIPSQAGAWEGEKTYLETWPKSPFRKRWDTEFHREDTERHRE